MSHVSPSIGQTADVRFNGFYCFILKFAKIGQGIYYLQQDGMPGEKPKFKVYNDLGVSPNSIVTLIQTKLFPLRKVNF